MHHHFTLPWFHVLADWNKENVSSNVQKIKSNLWFVDIVDEECMENWTHCLAAKHQVHWNASKIIFLASLLCISHRYVYISYA